MAATAASSTPCSARSRRTSFHRSGERWAAFSTAASVVRYTLRKGPWPRTRSTRSGAESATGGVTPVWSMDLYLPGAGPSYSAALVAALGRLQLGGHIEDPDHVLPGVVVVPDRGGQRAAVGTAVG